MCFSFNSRHICHCSLNGCLEPIFAIQTIFCDSAPLTLSFIDLKNAFGFIANATEMTSWDMVQFTTNCINLLLTHISINDPLPNSKGSISRALLFYFLCLSTPSFNLCHPICSEVTLPNDPTMLCTTP